MLRERGYEPASAWVKFRRPADPPPAAETELRIERIGPERGAVHRRSGERVRAQPGGHGDARAPARYLAHDGDLPVAWGAVFVRGGQSAITAARIAAARAAGAAVVVTEIGEPVPRRPQSSYRNILRAGFEPAYARPNYVSNPVPGTRASVVTRQTDA